ncbi:hypothetical protein [Paragemmobacter straminiformis]|uniref:General secretion pathway protein L n=1 Tax=Paragemmobacter straminiformis TaxID=2045119 RepID=A0A842IB12_9RHOB|nr:hypothetical protein [Gemmobacter straminiformis]MBC2836537.1 hypothetical protein [Gemmobacter straminiformis]
MIQSRLSRLVDDAALHVEGLLPPARRGLVPLALDAAEAAAIGDFPAAARISLTVGADRALIRRLELPAGTDIRRAVPIWLEDASPWAPGSYLWDAAQTATPGVWQVAMVPVAPLRLLEDRLERCGSSLAEVRLQPTDGAGFTFRPDLAGRARLRKRLIALAGGIMALGLGLLLWQVPSALAARAIAANAASEMARLQENGTLGAATAAVLSLQNDKLGTPDLAARLGFLASRLPTDTWLLHLGLEGNRFTLSGRSSAPEAIIPALSSADGPLSAQRVDFDGPMARDIQNGLFSFTVTGEFAFRGAKE